MLTTAGAEAATAGLGRKGEAENLINRVGTIIKFYFMSKKSIFMGAGTLVLAIAGFVAANANKKATIVKTAYFKTTATSTPMTLFKASTVQILTTVVTAGKTAFFRTVNSVPARNFILYNVRSGSTLTKTLFTKF